MHVRDKGWRHALDPFHRYTTAALLEESFRHSMRYDSVVKSSSSKQVPLAPHTCASFGLPPADTLSRSVLHAASSYLYASHRTCARVPDEYAVCGKSFEKQDNG